MQDIAILGAGGFAREVATIIEAINRQVPTWNFLGYIDNTLPEGTIINGFPVIGDDATILGKDMELALALAFGEPSLKRKVAGLYADSRFFFPALVHPSVIQGHSDSITFGKGCIICAGCILTTNIVVDDFVTFNLMCTVGHDSVIGRYSSFMPATNISGEVIVEEGVYVGTGAKIINQTCIGSDAIIGAGAVVTRNIPANCTAVGIPAKPIKFNE